MRREGGRKGPKEEGGKGWEVEGDGVDIAWSDLRDATAAASGPVGSESAR